MRKNILSIIVILVLALVTVGCASSGSGSPDPEKIVPRRDALIENLESSGYTVQTLSATEGSDLTVDRVLARKGQCQGDVSRGRFC